jgi:hypothetical protein
MLLARRKLRNVAAGRLPTALHISAPRTKDLLLSLLLRKASQLESAQGLFHSLSHNT